MYFGTEKVGGLDNEPLRFIAVTVESSLRRVEKLDQHAVRDGQTVGRLERARIHRKRLSKTVRRSATLGIDLPFA